MKLARTAFLITLFFINAVSSHAEETKRPRPANCELRLISNAGAGEIFLSIFTPNEEDCLAKSDQSVEARFHKQGSAVAKRGGAGPQP